MLKDNIELILPFKAEYVGVARLAASGIASRLSFDIDTVEDIKVVVSEVCNKLVNKGSSCCDSYKMIFVVSAGSLIINFDCEDSSLKQIFSEEEDEFAISIINALMDQVSFYPEVKYILSMSKVAE